MSANETDAYWVMRRLDVDYVLVLFGGLTGYASDDINKFLWMVRIGGSVYDWIKEPDYFTKKGECCLALSLVSILSSYDFSVFLCGSFCCWCCPRSPGFLFVSIFFLLCLPLTRAGGVR